MTPMAYWMIGTDRYLDPPDEPTHWECDKCGEVFDGGDLNHNKGGYEWICDECLEEVNQKPEIVNSELPRSVVTAGQGRLL